MEPPKFPVRFTQAGSGGERRQPWNLGVGRWTKPSPSPFLTAPAFEDGSLFTEVVPNTHFDGKAHALPDKRIDRSHWAGNRRTHRSGPNFISVEATTSPESGVVCRRG